jgi:hypothetical protein
MATLCKDKNMTNNLPLPKMLSDLFEAGNWKHPGDRVLFKKVPFIKEPLVFLGLTEAQERNYSALMGDNEIENETFSEYRGSLVDERGLPWLDIEKARIIACNKIPGDDIAIVLDYRKSKNDPRVVGTEWLKEDKLIWREICPSFSNFAHMIGMHCEHK